MADPVPYPPQPQAPPPVLGMVVAYFPHSNGSHFDWSGLAYKATVCGIADGGGVVAVRVPEVPGELRDVYWGHPHPITRRTDVPFAVPWLAEYESMPYDDALAAVFES